MFFTQRFRCLGGKHIFLKERVVFFATFLPNKAILRLVKMKSLEMSARFFMFFFGSNLTSLKIGLFYFTGTKK